MTADLLGFGAIIRNSTDSQRQGRINRWLKLVDIAAETAGLHKIQLISDTVFAATQSQQEGLQKLVTFSRFLLEEGIQKSLPVRGAIVHGEYEWGRLTYGQAVVDAHELEQAQNWIGISCEIKMPHVAGFWDREKLLVYPAPLKSGPIRMRPVVAWNVPTALELMRLLGAEGLAKDGELITWEQGEKMSNTVQFGIYQKLSLRHSLPPDKFSGLTVMDLIERAALR